MPAGGDSVPEREQRKHYDRIAPDVMIQDTLQS